jgi:hypothetical protein
MSSRTSVSTNSIQHSLKYLRERYRYELETGLLISRKTGLPVGSATRNRGLQIHLQLNGRSVMYYVHRLAVFIHTGIDPGNSVIYHRDGNNDNNRWDNLGFDDPANNPRNRIHQTKLGRQHGISVINTGKRKRWEARIKFAGKGIYLGRYKTFEEAVEARTKAETKYGFNLRHSL